MGTVMPRPTTLDPDAPMAPRFDLTWDDDEGTRRYRAPEPESTDEPTWWAPGAIADRR
jgi:hypothetical protein